MVKKHPKWSSPCGLEAGERMLPEGPAPLRSMARRRSTQAHTQTQTHTRARAVWREGPRLSTPWRDAAVPKHTRARARLEYLS